MLKWLAAHPNGYVRFELDLKGRLLIRAVDRNEWWHFSPPMESTGAREIEKWFKEILKNEANWPRQGS